MESNKLSDFKSNVADLTKIPPNEFEKYFQDWMERDDVARSLQAKLRCDLIKNFNKTYLGKHILSHTMTSSGGSTMRLTLSPLILALNTLVGEFLYSQNCHFTLSVFCTEIPFRNTLPDFESMQRFRFNNEEISEIWQAVTGSKANKRDLNKNIIQNYVTNPSMSLLLLIIKCLLQKDPLEQMKRNAGVQTDIQEKSHKSTLAHAANQDSKHSKATAKDANLDHINKYLLTLSEKVIEMTKEFEEFAKKRRKSRPHTLNPTRSLEYYTLNKSLERITENIKAMAQTKCKNKRLTNIVDSIDNLTQQFGICAQNFDNVTKYLGTKEDKPAMEKPRTAKVKLREKQTETGVQEKSYNDWIHEMRNTENGQKFLNRVESSLRKALTKHLDKLKSETDIKLKHLKSLMRLHYQQKLAKHLMQEPKINLEETRRCKDNMEKKFQQFESKQMELMQKLQESSLELKEAQLHQQESSTLIDGEKLHEKEDNASFGSILGTADIENRSRHKLKSTDLQHSQALDTDDKNIQQNKNSNTIFKTDPKTEEKTTQCSLRDVSKAQEQFLGISRNITEQGHSVDHIIYDAKLRIQQLENESNQLEQNFQSYLERRKRSEEQNNINQSMPKISPLISDLYHMTSVGLRQERQRPAHLEKYPEDEEIDKEFQRLKETLQQSHEPTSDKQKTAKSDSSTSSLEVRNAILEAKLKFFEHENTMRKCREQNDEIRTGNLLQKQLEKYSELQQLPNCSNHNFEHYFSETNIHVETETVDKYGLGFNLESSLSEININDKTLDEEQNIDLSSMTDQKSQKTQDIMPTSVKRELFPKDMKQNESNNSKNIQHEKLERDLKGGTEIKKSDTTSKLIKQSMAKMQQLFEQQSKSQETLMEMVNELQQERVLQREEGTTTLIHVRPHDALDKSLVTTITSTTAATTSTTRTSSEIEMKDLKSSNRISNTSEHPLLNLSNKSEDNKESNQQEIKMTADTLKEIDEEQAAIKESKGICQLYESSDSSELHSLPSPNKEYQKPEPNTQLELDQLNGSPKYSDLNLYSPDNEKEIGEILSESYRTFAPTDSKFGDSFSSRSSSDLEISPGQQNEDAKNLADDSESDFWA